MKAQLAIISLLTAASQLAALFKLRYTAQLFGVGSELDGYNLALVLPTFISAVLSGALQTGLFPVRARLQAKESAETLERFERSVFWGVAGVGLVISFGLSAGATLLAPLVTGSAPQTVQSAFRAVFPFSALLVAFNIVGDCAGYLLAMRNRFSIAAGAPIANGLFGGFVLAVWPQGGLASLVAATIFGLALQLAICLWGLVRANLPLLKPLLSWNEAQARFREMLALGGWILPGVFFSNLAVSYPQVWVSSFGEGAVSAFGYAYRLHSSALQLLVMASSTVLLSRFSELVARQENGAVRKLLRQAALASLLLGVIGIGAVYVLGTPVLQAVFGGRFDHEAALHVTSHWFYLTLGLPFAIFGNVQSKLWQANGRPILMSVMAAASLGALLLSNQLLRHVLHEYSVAASLSASAAVTLAIGLLFTRRMLNRASQ